MALDISGLTQEQQFKKAAEFAGVPESVFRGMWKTESAEGTQMRSPAGAEGHFGLMPATRATWEQRTGRSYDPDNFGDALTVAALTLKENLGATKGNIPDALRMYNAGTDRARWNNPETKAYVGKVLGPNAPMDNSEYAMREAATTGVDFTPPTTSQVWDTSAYDLLGAHNADVSGSASKEYLSDVEKGIMAQAGMEAAAAAGMSDGAAASVKARDAVHDAGMPALEQAVAVDRLDSTGDGTGAYDFGKQQAKIAEEQQAAEESVTFGDKVYASLDMNNITFNAIKLMMDTSRTRYDDDPSFDYMAHIDDIEKGYTDNEIDRLRENSGSMAQVRREQRAIAEDRNDAATLAANNGNVVLWSLGAGTADPAGWLAGMGVGKVAELTGLGARAAFMAGNIKRGFALNAAENAVGNTLATAALDAAGKTQTTHDYMYSAGFGLAFGTGFGLLEWRGAAKDVAKAEMNAVADNLRRESLERTKKLYEQAVAEAGPNASKEEIAAIASRLDSDEQGRVLDILFGDVEDDHRLFPRPDVDAEPEIQYVDVPNEFIATTPKGEFRLVDQEAAPGKDFSEFGQFREVTAYHGDEIVGTLLYANDGTPPTIEVNEAFRRQGIGTAMLKLAKERGGKLGEATTGMSGDKRPVYRTDDGQAFRSAADESKVTLKPRQEPNPKIAKQDHLPGAVLDTKSKRAKAAKQYVTAEMVSDDAERKVVNEVWARAERVLENNPIDKERLKPLLAKVGWEATSTRLLSSDNPVMRAAGLVLLENPEGAGGRRVTASMTKSMLERLYVGDTLRQYENAYKVWRNEHGGSAIKDFVSDRMRRRFDTEVYAERDRRFNNKPSQADHAAIHAAADALDDAYNRMRAHQKHVGTVGAARLADNDVRGYQPRRFSAGFVLAMTDKQRSAWLQALSKEFQATADFDKEFADDFAIKYLERIRKRAQGAYDVPANLHSDDAADMVRDTLRALSMNEEQIKTVMGRYSRGGAAHTKARIDADLTTLYPDGNGGNLRLMDMMDTNNVNLLRSYARRVSGEAALAKYGIMGEHGLKELRVAMEVGPDGQRATPAELEAFDQVAAEFLGKPFGTHLGKWADNARSFTSAMRLGGMGANQLNEYMNGIHALGVARTFSAIKSLPRMMRDVRAMKHGKPVANTLLGSIERIGGDFGMDGYRMRGLYDVNDGYEVYGTEALTVVDKAARGGSHAVRVLSAQRALTAVQIRGMAEQIVAKAGRYIKHGLEDKALDDMGITATIREAIRKSDAFEFDKDGHVIGFDVMKIDDTAAAGAFVQAVYRGSSQIIQDTYIGETGKWAHDGWLKMLTQFRAYGLTATQKQWGRQSAVHGIGKTIGYIMGAMSVAVPIHIARVQLQAINRPDRDAYLDKMLSPMALGAATMNYTAAIGILPDIMNISSAATGVQIGGYRGGNSNAVGQVVPVAGVVNDAFKATSSHDPHKIVKLLPGANLPFAHAFINLLDE